MTKQEMEYLQKRIEHYINLSNDRYRTPDSRERIIFEMQAEALMKFQRAILTKRYK